MSKNNKPIVIDLEPKGKRKKFVTKTTKKTTVKKEPPRHRFVLNLNENKPIPLDEELLEMLKMTEEKQITDKEIMSWPEKYGKDGFVTANGISIHKDAIAGLCKGRFCHADVINFYSEYLRSKVKDLKSKKYFIFPPEFINRSKNQKLLGFLHGKDLTVENAYKVFLIPLHFSDHWVTLAIFPKLHYIKENNEKSYINTNSVVVMDSYNGYCAGVRKTTIDKTIDKLKWFFSQVFPESKELLNEVWKVYDIPSPQQEENSNDCGYFVTYFIDVIYNKEYHTVDVFKNKNSFDEKDGRNQRQKIIHLIADFLSK